MVVFAFPESTFLFLGFALQQRPAHRLGCVTPKLLKAAYAWTAVPTEIAEPSSIS
jgi:hypothetical protein